VDIAMTIKQTLRFLLCLLALGALGACETISEKRKIDYKTTRTLPPLEVPPDLTGLPDTAIPGAPVAPPSKATYSEYVTDKKAPAPGAGAAVLPDVGDIRMMRDGQARWLVVKAAPDRVFPLVRSFILNNGLLIDKEKPEAGVLETDWAENRAKVGTGSQRLLAKWLGTLYSTGTRDKFRFRLERGAVPGTTEIYLSHRGMEEVVSHAAPDGMPAATLWQPAKSDPDLEAEVLQLLMVHLGRKEEQAKAVLAQGLATSPAERARLNRNGERVFLSLQDSLDRAWRRVGLSLDRIGFTVEDRDRSKGVYYVRYVDPEKAQNRPGFFSRMFGAEDKKPEEQYEIHLKAADGGTDVAVVGKESAPETAKTGERILSLLYEQLK
jgi:outer membrane protein assembly factor BamC